MKKWTKCIVGVASVAVLAFALVSLSCGKTKVSGSAETTFAGGTAGTAYAETPRNNYSPEQALSIVEALQTSFRYITDTMLPAVVEVDVTETKTYTNPMPSFGWPFDELLGNGSGSSNSKEYESKGLGSGVIVRRSGNILPPSLWNLGTPQQFPGQNLHPLLPRLCESRFPAAEHPGSIFWRIQRQKHLPLP